VKPRVARAWLHRDRPWSPPLSPNAWLRWEVVARRLPESARDVLEVGCGQGGFAVRLARRYRYLGLEPDAISFAVAQSRLAAQALVDAELRNGDLSLLGANEVFDLVCAFEVIEHIEDDHGALASWVDRLRPGGLLIVSAPAGSHRFAAADQMVGHFRRYDPPALQALLTDLGLEEVEVRRFGAPFGYLLEAIRNAIGRNMRRRLREEPLELRTARSGRLLQPRAGLIAASVYFLALPFRKLQVAFPDRGPGVLATGRRPPAASLTTHSESASESAASL
jgi:SAM-dependent methyltransferase